MATTALNDTGTVHDFYWTGPTPDVGTVLVTERGVGYLVRGVRPSRFLRAAVLRVLLVDPAHPSLARHPRGLWRWRGLRGHPKALERTAADVAAVGRAAGVRVARLLRSSPR